MQPTVFIFLGGLLATMSNFILATFAAAVFVTTALAEPPRPLEFRTIALNGDKGGTLAIVDGQPRLVNSTSAWNEWTSTGNRQGVDDPGPSIQRET